MPNAGGASSSDLPFTALATLFNLEDDADVVEVEAGNLEEKRLLPGESVFLVGRVGLVEEAS